MALVSRFNRDYFTRMWIIQEISLAQDVSIHCRLLSADFRNGQHLHDYFSIVGGETQAKSRLNKCAKFSTSR